MKSLLIVITLLLIPFSAHAKTEVIDIKVLGMVCDFCAQSVLKVIQEDENVENIDIDLQTGIVSVTMKPDTTLTKEQIQEYIYYSGYTLDGIERHSSAEEKEPMQNQ